MFSSHAFVILPFERTLEASYLRTRLALLSYTDNIALIILVSTILL